MVLSFPLRCTVFLNSLALLLLYLPPPCTPESQREEGPVTPSTTTEPYDNVSATYASPPARCGDAVECKPGILLPVWEPLNPGLGSKVGRAMVYFVFLMYLFLGVSIIADRFMASIEVITSQEKEVTITLPNGETSVATVRIWNETVSNLTLMALGSSAPEILLSVIEVCGHGFQSGDLGPGTIVGSAAFNMFVIIGICVWVIPGSEARKIKHLRVFFITAFWSIFAYIWLYLILAVISPGVVELWEALVTLCYFPVCVILAWIADRRLLFYKYMAKRYRADKRTGVVVETEGDMTPKGTDMMMDGKFVPKSLVGVMTPEQCQNLTADTMATLLNSNSPTVIMEIANELDESRKEVIRILKDLKQKYPDKELDQLMELANYYALLHQQKSRAFYRVQATRMMIGAGNVLKKHAADHARRAAVGSEEGVAEHEDYTTCSGIGFESAHSQCMENCGTLNLAVVCRGGTGDSTFYVDYHTEDGTANAGSDYEYCEGTLVFKPGETRKEIKVGIIDDDIFEEDEHFFVRLLNLRVGDAEGMFESDEAGQGPKGRLVEPQVSTVTILDDDHAGIFTFSERVMRVSESVGTMEVKVVRNSGARGTVILPYHTEPGTARGGGVDYEDASGELEFTNDQTTQTIQVRIIDDEEYEKQEHFFIVLEEPRWLKRGISALLLNQAINSPPTTPPPPPASPEDPEGPLSTEEEEARRIAEMGKPILGEHSRLEVVIEESYEFKSTVDKLIKKTNLALVIGTHSWREQFVEAVTVSAGDGDEDEEEGREGHPPSCSDYVMHFLTVFWKVLFACVPPTEYWNGWACFIVSISVIGMLTAVIGDLASHFGCTVGLKDTVTAVVFVALGTSIPDTFASKVAAIQDQYADASIGNVTGSNAVNVFLGIGVAWSVAAVYWWIKGEHFRVDPGTLAFSVTLFTIFAFICMAVLLLRRRPSVGGELGGPRLPRLLTTLLFLGLWFLYILFSSLEAYCHIEGF
ncbi:sodium/calcium exchanger 2b isoform X1 [Electrophorus electricus]|uniref:sodium/calcium exchanger 2b isoform X1 n=1 Tax=Electrophorus electricus TaxID=8005 RepID=UPI0015D032A7|nr:sodium/calcium exchanger 2b isoform X1 [Electrophorus electricus]XP_035390032.1 sodium/calcium exchanger 2b isoform X1 [Electrophorus electricus]